MNTEPNYSKKIQRYLSHEMTQQEVEAFETEIKTSTQLQNEIKLYRKVENALGDNRLADFKEELQDIHNANYGKNFKSRLLTPRVWYAAAAVLILFVTITSVFKFGQNSMEPTDIFEDYYKVADISITRGIDSQGLYMEGANDYAAGNYASSFEKFSQVLSVNSDHIAARFYAGVSAIELNKLEEAITYLSEVVKSKDLIFNQDARWYLALTYLKSEKINLAIEQFEIILNEDGAYASTADLILDSLN